MLTRVRPWSALQLDNMDQFVQHFLAALEDSRVVDRIHLIMQPSISESLDSVTGALKAMVADLQQTVNTLQSTIKKWDNEILNLSRDGNDLRAYNDDLEQHSRRASVRVFGVPENTPGSTDDTLLDLCNKVVASAGTRGDRDLAAHGTGRRGEDQVGRWADSGYSEASPNHCKARQSQDEGSNHACPKEPQENEVLSSDIGLRPCLTRSRRRHWRQWWRWSGYTDQTSLTFPETCVLCRCVFFFNSYPQIWFDRSYSLGLPHWRWSNSICMIAAKSVMWNQGCG